MAEIALPELQRPRTLRGVVVDVHDVAGAELFAVTAWQGAGRPAKRQWFASRSIALTNAADRADEHGLPLIDLTSEPEA